MSTSPREIENVIDKLSEILELDRRIIKNEISERLKRISNKIKDIHDDLNIDPVEVFDNKQKGVLAMRILDSVEVIQNELGLILVATGGIDHLDSSFFGEEDYLVDLIDEKISTSTDLLAALIN